MSSVKLANYLAEIEYAAVQIVDLIWQERREVESLEAEIDTLKSYVEREYSAAQQILQFAFSEKGLLFISINFSNNIPTLVSNRILTISFVCYGPARISIFIAVICDIPIPR